MMCTPHGVGAHAPAPTLPPRSYGFMSTTTDRTVAISYASTGSGGPVTPVVFQMQMGMIDRGAELSWLSQYPHENE